MYEVLTEMTKQQGGNFVDVPSMYSPEHIRAWRLITDAVHKKGGYMVCQLWHVRVFLPIRHPTY
jgi:2,4-dienoyl-CoA reductase-like NADH-dependent reductase (Old Yellow Enzyme family)